MEQKLKQRICIEFCVKLQISATETFEMLNKAFPNDAPKRTTVFEWHSRFKAGRISIEDDPRQGRPKFQRTDENVKKITDLIKENPRTTLLELEQDTGISKTTIGRIVTEDLKLKKTPAKFIPRFLTNEQKLCRLATCEDMMEMTRTDPEWKDKIITGDETWVYGYDPETKPQTAEWRDIAPNDFFLFPKLKAVLKGRHFDTRDDIIEKSPLALKSIPKEAYKNCFDNWEKRWRWFIRNIADILAPFYHLLKKNSKWNWTSEHRILFEKCKALLTNESVLAHYDATRELVLGCDASSYGLGVVLSHRNDRKEETPIAFASRTLTEAERRYSQLEKEALSIIFGCEKFRQYLLGREFVLITDNRPLMYIFSPQKPIPICAASRIKRWSLKLSAFKYTVEFRKTDDNGNADALSRLPLVSKTTESLDEDQVLLLRKMSEVPFSFQDVAVETRRDKLLSIVLRSVRGNNWQIPKVSQENPLYSYYRIKDELSCEFGCLQWRERVVIPQKLRSLILNDLHEMHLGMVKMKMIARRYFWWPGIDKNIEELARDCRICQESASMPPSTISEWTCPENPWHRLHLDLAGPLMGRMFMVLVDAYTKWLEIVIIKDITSRTIIGHLREIFARFGLPELLVTDNGRQFVSSEFEEFTTINGIRHTKTSPYNPSTNGLAERYVHEFKNSLRKNQGKNSIEINLQRFLFTHRAFPQTVLKESPAELLMKRSLRSRFSNLIPKMAKVGEVYHDAMRKQEHFAVGSDVYFRSFANGPKWKRGRIMELLSSRHYLIEDEGRYVKRHIN
ncbi:K02A2.6-like [Cordylochernes scorpioides]|uniref:RNA-directed DNA polymerase n=1 Tax=Cordylochernes scorpioides TaxID=51811 RepID=A0ABY6JV51_9ARAC|nr:K02A2.6-like [Cordylochernes scorpioides]